MSAPSRRHDIRQALLALGLCLIPFASPSFLDGRTVRVGVYENAPKVMFDQAGHPTGIFIDVIEAIAAAEGWTLEYVEGTWAEGLARLDNGAIDLMTDVAHTTERERRFAFHAEPVLSDWFQVYTRRGADLSSITEMQGKRVLVLDQSVQQEAFTQLSSSFGLELELVPMADYVQILRSLAAGEGDAAVLNRFHGRWHAQQYQLADTAIVFHPTSLFYAAPLSIDRTLLATIDTHLIQLKSDPNSAYYASLRRWTSDEVSFDLPQWIRVLGIITLTMFAMALVGTFLLKRQVNARTRELALRNDQLQTMYGELKNKEAKLLELNTGLEQRVEKRTRELATAKERAESADRLKSAFLATMSHELRTPLNSIIGFSGILLQGLAGPLNEEQKKQLGMVQNSSKHLLALINDVLDLSKIEAGQLKLSSEPFDLVSTLHKTVELVRPLAESKGLILNVELPVSAEEMTGDARRVQQIVLNLLSNAVKFTENGTVALRCQVADGWAELTIADTGIGIPPEEMEHLFQPFHQVDTGLTRKHDGTGLGLSICRKLASLMNGTISAESTPGEGSTFRVRLPLRAG